MTYCGACGYVMYDCVCERVEPHRAPNLAACFCCGVEPADPDELCDNDACSVYGLELA